MDSNNHYWSKKSVKESSSDCQNGDGFLKLVGMKLPDLIEFKLNERSVHAPNEKKRVKIIIVVSIISGMIVLNLVLCLILRKKWKRGQESCKDNVEVPLFDLASIDAATNSFSQENLIGIGGFGPVYKGILPTGKEVDVKRLSKNSGQGAEEFRNEVVLFAKLQHRNLVGLYGSCIQGEERLLVYEYMANKSLDYFIFDHDRRVLLAWQKRFDIIMQIVRGLLYLHQDSKLQIIHRDLKASNILLDSNMNPKISDFGVYMSPEYAVNGKFSAKSDVFSFGVLLLEIISGQKIRSFCHPYHHHSLLGHAWLLWNEGRAMDLVDACLEDSIVESQVLRCIQVGLLCVQNLPKDRPTMSSVNFMLANEEASLPHPKEPGFFTDTSCKANTATRKEELHTVNVVTITMMDNAMVGSDSSESYLWQSFDYPSNTWLPGDYTCRVENPELPQLVLSMGSIKKFRTGSWNGLWFSGLLPFSDPYFTLKLVFHISLSIMGSVDQQIATAEFRKNQFVSVDTGFYRSSSHNLLGYTWELWKGGRALELKDPTLED
ncbi:hypothetical protein CRYUN_Cryun11dG0028500 [Craigia yunnanensis]